MRRAAAGGRPADRNAPGPGSRRAKGRAAPRSAQKGRAPRARPGGGTVQAHGRPDRLGRAAPAQPIGAGS